jgi:hypothetical protein
MKRPKNNKGWDVISEFVRITSPWLTLIGEKLQDDEGKELEYWRAEKPDGLLIITVQNKNIILPKPMFRPGVGRYTLDFCGGRIIENSSLEKAAEQIVRRELNIGSKSTFASFEPVSDKAWDIDSSFTNVGLHVYLATLSPSIQLRSEDIGKRYSLTDEGVKEFFDDVVCLQCRAAMREWLAVSA